MIVVDASVVIDLLLGVGSDGGDTLGDYLRAGEVLAAPHLLDAEVGQAFRRYAIHGAISGPDAVAFVRDLLDIPVRRYPHTPILTRAFELRSNVTVYDALYLALAEAVDGPLLTGDVALGAVPGCRAMVQVVATSA